MKPAAGEVERVAARVSAVADEDADYLGLSLLSGAHMTLVPRVLDLLRAAKLDNVGVLVGGIIPEADVAKLLAMGVAPTDPSVDQARLAAMTVVAASVMNTPDAYTLR